MKAGLELKAARGGYAGFGSPPFGWWAEGGELVVDDDEQRVVDRIVGMHAEGHSQRDIARNLNADGVSTKRGAPWTSVQV